MSWQLSAIFTTKGSEDQDNFLSSSLNQYVMEATICLTEDKSLRSGSVMLESFEAKDIQYVHI